ncbi:hypothetical protein CLOM_g12964, partial [Closterium sp. NIES-68]
LSSNALSGSLPDSLSTLTALTWLDMRYNSLSGSIPAGLVNLVSLEYINLWGNRLNGPIPNGIGNLTRMVTLYLPSNSLIGSIPDSITKLTRLESLDLWSNHLTGSIPAGIGNLVSLTHMYLSTNYLSGPLPVSISRLTNLGSLHVDANNLTGTIPASLGRLQALRDLNIEITALVCPAHQSNCTISQYPNTVFCQTCSSFCSCGDNKGTAASGGGPNSTSTSNNNSSSTASAGGGGPNGTSSTSSNNSSSTASGGGGGPNGTSTSSKDTASTAASGGGGGVSVGVIIGIAAAAVAVVILLLLGAGLLVFSRHRMLQQQKPKDLGDSLAAAHCTEFSFSEVLQATDNWTAENQLGSGAFGDVYKGVSPRDGTTVWAVKRAKLIDMDFQREILQMADKNHHNIVRLLGFAVGGDIRSKIEQILIYEFVPNGDLHRWIDPEASNPLSFKQRMDILIGIARGFEYLHSFGIVHRDIKPANILITADMQAKIADFGLVRAGEGTTVGTTRIMGTPGYVDPVYTKTSKATFASDVYSFGVLILVVLTGQAPLMESCGETRQITSWASDCVSSGHLGGLKDPKMDAPGDAVLRVVYLAVSCTEERTASRPSMAHVANELQAIRDEVAGKDELRAAVKVDAQLLEMKSTFKGVTSFEDELRMIGESFSNED